MTNVGEKSVTILSDGTKVRLKASAKHCPAFPLYEIQHGKSNEISFKNR